MVARVTRGGASRLVCFGDDARLLVGANCGATSLANNSIEKVSVVVGCDDTTEIDLLFYWTEQNTLNASPPPRHNAPRREMVHPGSTHTRRHARATTRQRPCTQKQKPDKRHPTRQTPPQTAKQEPKKTATKRQLELCEEEA
jgi:hypothetical protein